MKKLFSFSRLQRYLLAQVTIPFISGVTIFLFILMSLQLFVLSEMILVHDFSISFILTVLGLLSLKLFPIVLPIAFLFAILMTISKMSSDSELIAMRALGIGLYSILKPILFLGVLVSATVMWCNMDLVPTANRTLRNLIIKASSTKALATIKPGTFTSGFFDLVVFANKVDTKNNKFSEVFIFDSRTKTKYAMVGESGTTIPLDSSNPFETNSVLQINDGSIFFNSDKQNNIIHFNRYQISLSINQSDDEAALKPRSMSFSELKKKMEDPPNEKERILFTLEFHQRFAIGFGCIVFAVLGLAFGISPPRGQQKGGVLISIIVLVSYYTFSLVGGQLSERGFVPPMVVSWAPNFIALAIGLRKLQSYKRSFH